MAYDFTGVDVGGNRRPRPPSGLDTTKTFAVIDGLDGKRTTIQKPGDPAVVTNTPVVEPTYAELQAKLVILKAERSQQINVRRDAALNKGFVYDEMRFDSDPKSAATIESLGQAAFEAEVRGQEWSTVFKLADNSTVTLSRSRMQLVKKAWLAYRDLAVQNSFRLKDLVTAATKASEVTSVNIEGGWPG